MTPNMLFDSLWQDFSTRLCPSALKIHDLLEEGSTLINDHIALRTFNLEPVCLDKLAQHFLQVGYVEKGQYRFDNKKLVAKHYEHSDTSLPKVFISELEVEKCTPAAQKIIKALVSGIGNDYFERPASLWLGKPWEVSIDQYLMLSKESEYAAWLSAHGYGANHFTVSVNQLNRFNEVQDVNDFLKQHGFLINGSGGEVKGGQHVFLGQSSTMADRVDVEFLEGELYVPGGFYEFAKRYPMDDGKLYSGFVEASADKIFESTNQR